MNEYNLEEAIMESQWQDYNNVINFEEEEEIE